MARTSHHAVHPRQLVLERLRTQRGPMTAYGLLEALRGHGIKSPPIIYRALAELEKDGSVHKIHAMGAYVACACPDDHAHPLSVLTVCGDCKTVTELHDHAVIDHLAQLRQMQVNLPDAAVIELPVTCPACAA